MQRVWAASTNWRNWTLVQCTKVQWTKVHKTIVQWNCARWIERSNELQDQRITRATYLLPWRSRHPSDEHRDAPPSRPGLPANRPAFFPWLALDEP